MIEVIFAIFFIILAISFLIQALDLSMVLPNGVISAGFFPTILSVLLLILLLIYLSQVILKRKKESTKQVETTTRLVVRKQILSVVAIILAIVIFPYLGMLTTLGIYMFLALIFIEKIKWLRSLVFSLSTMILLYLLFVVWLDLRLPQGIFV